MRFTRRQMLKSLWLGFMAGVILPGCCVFTKCKTDVTEATLKWKKDIAGWWKIRQTERSRQRQKERADGTRPNITTPRPHLVCGKKESSHGYLGVQVSAIGLDEEGKIAFMIENKGNANSWSCYAEMYEAPFVAFDISFKELHLTDRKIVSVLAGEAKEVSLKFKRTMAAHGSIIIRCYDPVLDTGLMAYEQYDRKNSGMGFAAIGG